MKYTLKQKSLFGFIVASSLSSGLAMADMIPHYAEEDEGIWQAGFQGEYYAQSNNLIQANSLAANFANTINQLTPISTPVLDTDPKKAWGYTIFFGYIFPEHEYDIQGSVTFLKSDQTLYGSSSATDIAPGEPSSISRNAKLSNDFDEWELTVGNYLEISDRFMARLGFGIAYVSIRESSNDHIITIVPGEQPPETETQGRFSNKFWGIGPKLTFDGQFDINRFFSVVSGVGASLLIGESESSLSTNNNSIKNVIVSNPGSEETQVALGIDGKFGLRWAQAFNRDISWDIEAGYQASTYLNALQEHTSNASGTGVALASAQLNANENYWNYGPYVGIGVDFM